MVREEPGEIELNNGLGAKMLLQRRGWKRNGQPNPNAAVGMVVVPVVGMVAPPVAATMIRGQVGEVGQVGQVGQVVRCQGLSSNS